MTVYNQLAYDAEVRRRLEKDREKSQFIGRLKQVVKVNLFIRAKIPLKGSPHHSPSYVHIGKSPLGNVVIYIGPEIRNIHTGSKLDAKDKVVLSGIIKAHRVRDGVCQTILKNCEVTKDAYSDGKDDDESRKPHPAHDEGF